MENLLTDKSTSFETGGLHSSTRPKFQPVRVKTLLRFCESEEEENEEKAANFEEESDSDGVQSLSPNDSMDAMTDESYQCIINSNNAYQDSQKCSVNEICHNNLQSEHKIHSDNSDNKCSSTSIGTHTTILHKSNNEKPNDDKEKDEMQYIIKSSQLSDIERKESDHLRDRYPLSCSFKDIVRSERNVCLQSQTFQENKDILSKNQQDINHMDCDLKENHIAGALYNFGDISRPCNYIVSSNTMETKCTSNERNLYLRNGLFSSTPLIPGKKFSQSDTPLTHYSINSNKPKSCFLHRNIFQTPQSKMQVELQKHTVLTPLTAFSHSLQNHTRQTPLQSIGQNALDPVKTPINSSIFVQGKTQNNTPRCPCMEKKALRRPLAISASSIQTSSAYEVPVCPVESKHRTIHNIQLSKVEEVEHDPADTILNTKQQSIEKNIDSEVPTRETHEVPAKKLIEVEVDCRKGNIEQCKEEIQSKVVTIETKEAHEEAAQTIILTNTSNTNACVKKEEKQHINDEENVLLKEYKTNNVPLKSHSVDVKRAEQNSRQVVSSTANVQFSLPSDLSTSVERHKKLIVKNKEYLILGTLGRGMSGEVLRVQDLSSSELRAIKCVNLSLMDKESAEGCLKEISMLHKLQAPCVVRMFDYEIKYPLVYVIMEMGDTDLSRLLKLMSQEKQLPLTMILHYWMEMLTAVKHIHDNGVIHSDLKPANFLLVRGRLKLIDFGIASNVNGDMTSVVKNCPIGTLNYISPEALMDIGGSEDSPNHNVKYKINFKSDVWSLGCILYSLVYGHTPFHHIRSQWAKVNAITNPKPNIEFPTVVTFSDKADKFEPPTILIDVMRKCLQHDPKARPTVAELMQMQYIPTKQSVTNISALTSDIPQNILVKIKHALTEEEWRKLIQVLKRKSV